ncbi:hypothetical protein ACMBCN_01885 [Candidatus Liberibacter asiaticus]|nr:hypothetical protein [Candidatus Liberibacter asiaticus]
MLFVSLLLLLLLFIMFVGIITEKLHETSIRLLGQSRGLTTCCMLNATMTIYGSDLGYYRLIFIVL